MYSKTWPSYPSTGGTGAGYPGMPTGVGGVTGTMPGNGGYPGMPTGVGGVSGTMPGNVGYPGMVPGTGYPGMMPGVGGVTGTMPTAGTGTGMMPGLVGGVTGTMPGALPPSVPSGLPITPGGQVLPVTGQEESYVENILRMNLGKVATIYMTFENNCEWNAKVFKGVLEAAGRDHIIISDPTTGKRYLLLTVNLDYITFDEPLNYTLPFGTTGTMGATSFTRPE